MVIPEIFNVLSNFGTKMRIRFVIVLLSEINNLSIGPINDEILPIFDRIFLKDPRKRPRYLILVFEGIVESN